MRKQICFLHKWAFIIVGTLILLSACQQVGTSNTYSVLSAIKVLEVGYYPSTERGRCIMLSPGNYHQEMTVVEKRDDSTEIWSIDKKGYDVLTHSLPLGSCIFYQKNWYIATPA